MSRQPSEDAAGIATTDLFNQGEFEFWTMKENGVDFKASTPREVWLDFMRKACSMHESSGRLHFRSMCIVADGLNAGEALFGEEYAQAIDDTRKWMQVSSKTLHNAMWILKSVASERRHELLTLAHHEVVAPLQPEEQKEFLDQAESENLTVSALKKIVKERHPNTKRGKTRKAVIDLKSEEGLHHAMEKVGEWLTEQAEAKVKLSKKWQAALLPAYKGYRRCFMGSGHKA